MTTHLFRRGRAGLAAGALAVFASGCAAVGPAYQRPEMKPPEQFRGVQGAAAPESIADAGWWKIFDDAALQKLIREGLANNLDLKVAAARVVESRALAGVAKSYLYPTVGVGFGYTGETRSRLAEPDLPANAVKDVTYNNFALSGSLSWEIDLFGRIRRENEAAVARYFATEEGRRAVLITLVADISATYFYLRELEHELDIARRTVKLNDDTVVYYQNRLAGGVSNRLEVDQAKANRSVTAATIPALELQFAVAENALSVLLGRMPGTLERGRALNDQQMPPGVPAGLPAKLLERRPDVVQAEQLLIAANADVGAAKALFYPTISLTGSLGSVSGSFTNLLRPDSIIWSLGSGIFQPILNGNRIRRNYDAAQARYEQALFQYQKAALSAYREVADSLVTIEKLAQRRAELEPGVEALRDAVQLSRSRYENGLSTYLEVILADQQLFQQELQLAEVRGQQLRAVAQLYRALGGGWQPEEPNQPPQAAASPRVAARRP